MSGFRILVVEDEEPIRGFIRINLERNGFEVREAASGEEALNLMLETLPHLVVLDLKLPGMDGLEVCRILRQKYPQVAVLMLTARGQDMDRVKGLEMGADDYVVKPFNPLELVASVKAILRRVFPAADGVICYGDLSIFPAARQVKKGGKLLELTHREFDLLLFLARNPGRVFNRDELLDHVWGENYFGDPKTVDVYIRRLRAKLENGRANPGFIETVWGVGYRWRAE
ncbi:two component transcriptional regulator, winged helix family [Desulfofundulus kuznetsovii DSM 6115]|uniref:Stage 0 sporulation protein A homolog n=1 Tax=Desulfofundulus kuznetsovii (strain DSM 6115 / VKM B-1805 / 17) TaxID=760568 RepID=A0AAU8PDY5_DESK7|nr:two component transcriptional regulator, winged helix family [Desulfofundulus kuznetsovii DSM 6115]